MNYCKIYQTLVSKIVGNLQISLIDDNLVEEFVNVSDAEKIVLVNGYNNLFKKIEKEMSRNIFLVDNNGKVIWRIHSNFDSTAGRFLGVSLKNNKVIAVRWDGGLYSIDKKTGFATPEMLIK